MYTIGLDHQGAQPTAGLDYGDRIIGHSWLFVLARDVHSFGGSPDPAARSTVGLQVMRPIDAPTLYDLVGPDQVADSAPFFHFLPGVMRGTHSAEFSALSHLGPVETPSFLTQIELFSMAWMTNMVQRGGPRRTPLCLPLRGSEFRVLRRL